MRAIDHTNRESDGVYWATLRIGSPKQQSFSVIVDTGSSTIAVPCKGCGDCGSQHAHFDPAKSRTVEVVGKQQYRQCYSEGSCNFGDVLADVACFGAKCQVKDAVRHRFGCCSKYAPAFKSQDADGIIGLSGSPDTLVASLRAQHHLHRDMFSLCFGRTRGLLTVGGVFHRPLVQELQYVPLLGGAFYSVHLADVSIGGKSVREIGGGGGLAYVPMLDSGSTFTYFPRQLHKDAREAFTRFCEEKEDAGPRCRGTLNPPGTPQEDVRDSLVCYSPPPPSSSSNFTSVADWLASDFPQISLQLDSDGATHMCLSPQSYFFKSAPGVYCVGIFPERGNRMVIGAISMTDYTVVFDHDANRVGFAKSNCEADPRRRLDCCGGKCPGYTYVAPEGQTLRPTTVEYLGRYNSDMGGGGGGKKQKEKEEETEEEGGDVAEWKPGQVGPVGENDEDDGSGGVAVALSVTLSALAGVGCALACFCVCGRRCSRLRAGFSRLAGEEEEEEAAGLQVEEEQDVVVDEEEQLHWQEKQRRGEGDTWQQQQPSEPVVDTSPADVTPPSSVEKEEEEPAVPAATAVTTT